MPDNEAQLALLKEINDKTDRTDNYLRDLATAMQELAVTMAGLRTSHEHVQKQQLLQKERDEHQDFKIDCIEGDVHNIEKALIPLESLPEKVSKNSHLSKENAQRLDSHVERFKSLEKRVESQESSIKELEKEQLVDSGNWKTFKGVGSFLLKYVVPSAVAGIGSALLILFTGNKEL